MHITLKCPLGHVRRVGPEYAGKRVVCDECGHVWKVPKRASSREDALFNSVLHGEPVHDPDEPAEAGSDPEDVTIACPACAERIKAAARTCRFCGHELGVPPDRPCFRCPLCKSTRPPRIELRMNTAGWVTAIILLVACLPLFWIPFFISALKEEVRFCGHCGGRIG